MDAETGGDESHILLIDRDLAACVETTGPLEQAGFCLSIVDHCDDVLNTIQINHIDLVIVAERNNSAELEPLFCAISSQSPIPTILVTDLCEAQETLHVLSEGMTDFILRPVRKDELLVRVHHILKQNFLHREIYRFGDLLLNRQMQKVWKNNKLISVTPTGLNLLQYFMTHPGVTVKKHELLKKVWGYENFAGDLNLVDTAIRRLRHAIEENPKKPEYIITVWGEGYRFGW